MFENHYEELFLRKEDQQISRITIFQILYGTQV